MSMVPNSAVLPLVALCALGCRKLDPVPADADGAAAWLYEHQEDGTPEEIDLATGNLVDALDLDALEEPFEGLLVPLDADAVAAVGREAVEALPEDEQADVDDDDLDAGTYVRLADQQGMITATVIPCDVEATAAVFVRVDQDVIHGGYDAYDRTWQTDGDAYLDGSADDLSWRTEYTVSVLGSTYDATILGQIRRVEPEEADAVVVARAVLPEPGTFSRGGQYFRQDYHLDLFLPHGDGETLHVFAVWRDMNIGGIHSSNAAYISTVSARFVDSDEEIGALCSAR